MKKIGLFLLTGLVRFFALFPLKVHYFWADFIAWFLNKILHYRRDVVLINLSKSFPEKKYWELEDLLKKFYTHMAEIMVETVWFAGSSPKRLRESGIVSFKSLDTLVEAYENSPSLMVFYSHCGNWELLGGFESYLNKCNDEFPIGEHNFRIVYKKLKSYVWDEFLKQNRVAPTRDFHGLIESDQLIRYVVKHKSEKLCYMLNIDQSPYKGAGAYPIGLFMNQPTNTAIGLAGIANKFKMRVMYMSYNRVSRGKYELDFQTICEDASKEEPIMIIRKYYDLLEEEIRQNPMNWLWSHKRWKQDVDMQNINSLIKNEN